MSKLSCEVTGDLLPLYLENMVSADTKAAVEEHLSECESCRARFEQMTTSLPAEVERNIEQAKPLKKFRFHMLLNILGFPIWLPLLAVAFAVALTVYVCIWVVDVCVWTLPISLGAASLASVVSAAVSFADGAAGNGVLYIGCVFAFGGLALLMLWPSLKLTELVVRFTAFLFEKLKRLIGIKKEEAKNV